MRQCWSRRNAIVHFLDCFGGVLVIQKSANLGIVETENFWKLISPWLCCSSVNSEVLEIQKLYKLTSSWKCVYVDLYVQSSTGGRNKKCYINFWDVLLRWRIKKVVPDTRFAKVEVCWGVHRAPLMKNGQRCGGTKRRSDLLAGAELFVFVYGNHRYVIFVLCWAELFFSSMEIVVSPQK